MSCSSHGISKYLFFSAIEKLPDIPGDKVARAPKWTDEKGFELLKLFVHYAKYPFLHGLRYNQRRKQSAEETIQLLLDKTTICVEGEDIPLRELASLPSIWDRLTGKDGRGFSFARDKSLLSFVDDEMEGNNNDCTSHGNDSKPPMWSEDSQSLYKSW